MQPFFKNLKVVELASVLAGPVVGTFFAELGAEVLKIENQKTGGDMTRGWRLPTEPTDSPISAYWSSVNFGKQVFLKNLDDEADKNWVLEKISQADVVISNFKPASARRMGFDHERLRAENPRLIFAQIDAFADPNDPRPAFDIVLQAEAGFVSMMGESAERPSVRMPVALVDSAAAHQLKEGILVALLQRERTGEGSFVRTSLYESAVSSLINQASNWLMEGHLPQKMGMRHPNIAPYGDVFTTKDGLEIVLAVGTERQFEQLCRVLKLEILTQFPDFQRNASRVKNRAALCELLAAAISTFDRADLVEKLHAAAVPVARILNLQEVFAQPEAERLILDEIIDGRLTRRVRTTAFSIE